MVTIAVWQRKFNDRTVHFSKNGILLFSNIFPKIYGKFLKLSNTIFYIFSNSPITKNNVHMTIIYFYYLKLEQTKDSWNCRLVYNLQFKEFFKRFSWKLFLKSKLKPVLCKIVQMQEKLGHSFNVDRSASAPKVAVW